MIKRLNQRSGKSRLRLVALVALLGFMPAACSAEPVAEGAESPSWLVLAAADHLEQVAAEEAESEFLSPYGAYLAGLSAGRRGDLSVAADYMLRALDGDPQNKELLGTAFLLVAGDGRHEQGLELAHRLIGIDPENGTAMLVMAVDAVDRDALPEAQELLQSMPEKGISSLLAPLMRGWVRLGQGSLADALAEAEKLKDLTGFDMLYRLHGALMNDVAGQVEAAQQGYQVALDQSGAASLRLAWLVGNFYERQGDPEQASRIYREFLDANPRSSLIEPLLERAQRGVGAAQAIRDAKDGMAEVLFNIASLLSQERAQTLALVHVQQALRLRPDFTLAQVLLGEILQSQSRGKEAIAAYRRVPEASPLSWMVGLRIAEELERMDMTGEAVAELDRLAGERPNQYEPLYRKANMLRVQERYDDAITAYSAALERVEEIDQQHWSLFYFRGISYERSGEWDKAEADFLQALDLDPEQPYVMNYLAYSWVEQERNLEQAEEMLVRAVELRPNDGFIVDSLGWVYYQLSAFEKAVKRLEQAVELRPQDPVINDHLGDAFWQVGRRTEARFQWRRALSLEPEDDQVPLILEKIENGMANLPKDT